MTRVPLRLGPMAVPGYEVKHSGVQWLREDGYLCRPGEIIAFVNVGLSQTGRTPDNGLAFPYDERELKTALAPATGGRLGRAPNSSYGGFFDAHSVFPWKPDSVIGSIEPIAGQAPVVADSEVRLITSVGNRFDLVSRAWRVEDDKPIGTVLSLGICELNGVFTGDEYEILMSAPGPAHVVVVPDQALLPNARILAEQIRRTEAEREAIARDMADGLLGGSVTPTPDDWLFAGTMLGALLEESPTTKHYAVLTRERLRQAGPADAIVLSLSAEGRTLFKHRRLGYAYQCHGYWLRTAGPAFLAWLRANFVRVSRNIADIRRDYRELIALIRATAPATQILIHNIMSSSGYEEIQTYAAYDAPLGASLAKIHDKDMNLMLHDLARECDIAIVDADAIAAELGGLRCLVFDSVHQSGLMQAEVRAEILRILRARNVPGFS